MGVDNVKLYKQNFVNMETYKKKSRTLKSPMVFAIFLILVHES